MTSGQIAILHGHIDRAEALARLLRFSGHRCTVVKEGPTAAPTLLGLGPDLVLGALCFEDPPLGQLLGSVRETLVRHLPLLLVVGREDGGDFSLGWVDEIIREPVDPAELTLRVRSMLHRLGERRILERKLDELVGLHGISWGSVSLAGGPEALYGHLTRQSAELLAAEKALVLLFDAETREMIAQLPAYGLDSDRVRKVRYPVDGEAKDRWNFRTNGSLVASDAATDPRLVPHAVAELGLRNVAIVPMTTGGRVMGLLCVADRRKDRFQDADLSLLEAVAAQATVVLENQRLHEALKDANLRLQELDKLKREFVTMVAHDFRNPLMAIRGFAELVLEDSDIGAENRRELMRTIIGQTEDLTRLAEDTFLITQMETGQFTYRFRSIELGPFLLDAVARVPAENPLIMDVPARLPRIEVDPERLRQVVTNLVSNAVRYSSPQRPITLRCRERESGNILLEVIDSGFGIPEDQVGRLFQKFARVRSEEHGRISGTGLGLYICRLIVEGHGGRIGVKSELDKGSIFWVLLPLQRGVSSRSSKGTLNAADPEADHRPSAGPQGLTTPRQGDDVA
jgi:signal transduction histidine kinase